jgi:hypothetical protein
VKFKLFFHHSTVIYFVIFLPALVHPDNQLLGFLAYSAVDAMRAIELSRGEFLLVFQTLGVYVDAQGRKSRDREIMYPAIPQAVSKLLEFNLQLLLI